MKIEQSQHLDALQFDDRGLLPIVVQHATSGEVLMVAFADRAALERTLATRVLWFYSRSRQRLWQKGETSGNLQRLVELHADCDADTVLARVIPAGPACHTGARNCFGTAPTLRQLATVIAQRAATHEARSHTTRLLGDANLRLKKLGEEATELALACQAGDTGRVREEAADLLYHLLVAAAAEGVGLEDVLEELEDRFNASAGGSAGGTTAATGTIPGSPGPVNGD